MENDIERRASFDFIRYANCWEDADVLCEALQPGPGRRILSIGSAGDNALALAAEGADVVVTDISPAQLACLELRCSAFRSLAYEQVLAFLGVKPCPNRLRTYSQLENGLSPPSREFWQRNRHAIQSGVIHAGKFEAYLRRFRKWVLPLVHSRHTVERLLESKSLDARERFWNDTWDTRRWRLLFRLFFSRFVMGRLGRDPEFFRYVQGSVADRILKRTGQALTSLPTHTNPYLDYIASGNFVRALPRYLQPARFDAVRGGLDRLTLYHGPAERAARHHAASGFDAFNLSDIFEYQDPHLARQVYAELVTTAQRGARLAYWNMLVPRSCPPNLSRPVRPMTELSEELFARDRAFFYCAFHVDEVT